MSESFFTENKRALAVIVVVVLILSISLPILFLDLGFKDDANEQKVDTDGDGLLDKYEKENDLDWEYTNFCDIDGD